MAHDRTAPLGERWSWLFGAVRAPAERRSPADLRERLPPRVPGESAGPPRPVRPPSGPPSDPPPGPPIPRLRARRRRRRLLRRLVVLALVAQVLLGVFLVALRWWAPDRTSFMLQADGPVTYQYVSLDHVSRYTVAAVVAHEDEQLGARAGAFTWQELRSRATSWALGQTDPSGSTLPQQLAKNVLLWPHQDPVRKGVEAVVASEMTATLSDRRMVELYVNYAQFGPRLYGVCAASWYYFGTPPWEMTEYQAAQLMGVLPLPDRVTRAPGGGIDTGPDADPAAADLVDGAANVHVPRELAGMGGWRAAVATIGITDTAADHAADREDPDACSTVPAAVADRLAAG